MGHIFCLKHFLVFNYAETQNFFCLLIFLKLLRHKHSMVYVKYESYVGVSNISTALNKNV